MAVQQFRPLGTAATPADWAIPAASVLELLQVFASFDGSGAGSDFFPCLEIIDDAGLTAAVYVGTKITAGGSADVTWFPGVKPAAVAASGSGIQFDTDPQSGGYLIVTTTGDTPEFDGAIVFTDSGGSGIEFHTTGRSDDGGGFYTDFNDTVFSGGTDTAVDAQAEGNAGANIRGGNFNALAGGTSGYSVGVNAQAQGNATGGAFAVEAGAQVAAGSGTANAIGVDAQGTITHTTTGTGDGIGVAGHGVSANVGRAIGLKSLAEGANLGSGDIIGLYVATLQDAGNTGTVYGMQVFIGATKVFQINADGSLHGLTGKALTFDL